jgi:hypothetical protein
VHRFRQRDAILLARQYKIYHDEVQLIAAARQGGGGGTGMIVRGRYFVIGQVITDWLKSKLNRAWPI